MTRINCGIEPYELPDKLLLAEHREITRIPNTVNSGRAKLVDIPTEFTLGMGHVKFFYNKLGYLKQRYLGLYEECGKRGFNVTNKETAFDCPPELMGNYLPRKKDRQLIIERIESKGFKLNDRPTGN